MYKILIADHRFPSLKYEKMIFSEIGARLLEGQCKNEEDIINFAKRNGRIDGLLVLFIPISKKVFKDLPHLKVIGRYGIGIDMIDIKEATKNKVCIINVPNYCTDEVSNHTLCLLLACSRRLIYFNNLAKSGNCKFRIDEMIYGLRGKTVGLIGFGKIAQNLATKLLPFKVDILVFKPNLEENLRKRYKVKPVSLPELLKNSDFISLHIPLNELTRHMIGIQELKIMKKNAFLINTARGAIIDEKALIEVLKNKNIAGAALDVAEIEPICKNNPLLNLNNLILTPHIAWYSEEAQKKLQIELAQGVADVLIGKKPKNLVNKEVWNF